MTHGSLVRVSSRCLTATRKPSVSQGAAASTRPEPTVGVTNGSLDAVCHRIAGERQADHESGRWQVR
ncbi:hypothetical protein O3P69_011689 [Scylla paramamosain]|uniref:Uncharacterized protein n=1 Tax=Scylla paramamosain TaxID=85552 RepID=A0AAW0SDE3_SCYPA